MQYSLEIGLGDGMQKTSVFLSATCAAVTFVFLGATAGFAQVKSTGRIYSPPAPQTTPTPSPASATQPAEGEPAAIEQDSPPTPPRGVRNERSLENGGRLDLVCAGEGAANKFYSVDSQGSFSGNVNSYGAHLGSIDGSTSQTVTGFRSQDFGDQVSLFIESGEGRLRMPRVMLPPIRGGEDGWFRLKNIQIKEKEITASISVNPFNNPKLRIDRYTGAISISGKAGDYAGQCQRFVPEETQKQF